MRLTSAIAAPAVFMLAVAFAEPVDYLFRGERVCDFAEVFCLRGTLTYQANPRLLHLRARVQFAPGPGLLRIRFSGANELGHPRSAPFELRLQGRPSEIIDHKMIPDHPDVSQWNVEMIEFITDEAR